MVSLDEIDESVTLALLGHLHRNQKVNGRESWLYPGSALPMSFAEKGYRHGAVYYEIEDGRLNGVSEFLDYPYSIHWFLFRRNRFRWPRCSTCCVLCPIKIK